MDETVDFEEIALATSGAVDLDLANMINEAALGAVKAGRKAVSQKDLFEAVEVVIAGKEKKDRILGDEERNTSLHTMSRTCTGYGIAKRIRTSTEDHHRTSYHGSTWIYNAASRRRKILK